MTKQVEKEIRDIKDKIRKYHAQIVETKERMVKKFHEANGLADELARMRYDVKMLEKALESLGRQHGNNQVELITADHINPRNL